MKPSTTLASAALMATASLAAPANDHVRRDLHQRGHSVEAPSFSLTYAWGTAWGTASSPPYPNPTGMLPPSQPQPTGVLPTGVPPPPGAMPTGIWGDLPSCPVDGALVCNGPKHFGLCNWGHVFFMEVADGTACVDGKIVGTGIYAVPTARATA